MKRYAYEGIKPKMYKGLPTLYVHKRNPYSYYSLEMYGVDFHSTRHYCIIDGQTLSTIRCENLEYAYSHFKVFKQELFKLRDMYK